MDIVKDDRNAQSITSFSDPVGRLLYDQTLHGSELCDVSLMYAGEAQKVHKCVLMTSQYFYALYESGLLESKDEVTINVGSPSAIKAAVRFLYLRRLEVSLENVAELMEVADYLQISQMKEQCVKFLKHLPVTPVSCIVNCLICSQYGMEELYQQGQEYLFSHLPEVLNEEKILSLDGESVLEIFKDDTLSYVPVEDLFSFMARWVEFDLDKRLPLVPELFCNLNLERFSEESFNKLVGCHVIVNMFPSCRDHLAKFSSHLSLGHVRMNTDKKELFLMAGHEAEPHAVLAEDYRNIEVVGTRRLLGYLPWERRWIELSPIPIKFTSQTLLTGSADLVYATESKPFLRTENVQQMFKLDISNKKWTEFRSLIPYYERNKSFCVLSINYCRDRVYALASTQSSDTPGLVFNLYQLEEGNVSEFVWKKELLIGEDIPPTATAQLILVNQRHFCLAVKYGSESEELMKVMVYDLDNDEVTDCSKGSLTLLLLFARDGELVLAEPGIGYAKVLSLETKSWRVEPKLGIPKIPESVERSNFNSFYDSQKLFIFGGRHLESTKFLKSTYVFDFVTRTWEKEKFSPSRVVKSVSSVIQINSEAVRCDVNCPHCQFVGLKQTTEYELLPVLRRLTEEGLEEGWESEDEGDSDGVNLDVRLES